MSGQGTKSKKQFEYEKRMNSVDLLVDGNLIGSFYGVTSKKCSPYLSDLKQR